MDDRELEPFKDKNTLKKNQNANYIHFDVDRIRHDFPILQRIVNGKPITYFDSAATSLKPQSVIDAVNQFYTQSCANIHRGVHLLSQEASELYEDSRRKVASFLNADVEEIVFVRNATEAINLLCHSLHREGDIVATMADHHSSLLPWIERRSVRYVDLEKDGSLSMSSFNKVVTTDTALVCVPYISNALGVISPIREITSIAHNSGALVMIDGSQSVPHILTNVRDLGCDFLVFSGHKMLGPSGIGVLFGKRELLDKMQPFLRGGDMNKEVHKGWFVPEDLPGKFEAGTPNIEGAIGLGAAVDYLENIGLENVQKHIHNLTETALNELLKIDRIHIHGPLDSDRRSASISFEMPGLEAHGLAKMLSNRYNIMARSGYHCAQPLHEELGISQTTRASFYIYNTIEEIKSLRNALAEIAEIYTRKA
ncbi:aminotransferase class V-fold PLP-dependent enzyme [bacterium]|nr:aminotransferase class V-fold PLP-dependent enzyme [bacterium]